MQEVTRFETDVLILGGGLAALRAAVAVGAAGCRSILLVKGLAGHSGASAITSTGYAVAIGHADPADTPEQHYQDTLRGGAYLNHPQLAQSVCEEGLDRFWELVEWGVAFEPTAEPGKIMQYPGGGHSRPRVTVAASQSGLDLLAPLKARLHETTCLERVMALDLLTDGHGVCGALGLDLQARALVVVLARAVILACGGIGQLYPVTSNPSDLTADGLALAYRAGAVLSDLEFIQFYPWRILHPSRGTLRLEPATFACGAALLNSQGRRFMAEQFPEHKEASTRDLSARAINTEIVEGRGVQGGVRVDLSGIRLEDFAHLNPRVANYYERQKLDFATTPLIVAPEAHYHMGGIRIDADGQTSLPGLFAAGEASSGAHGANRIDSNAIPEGLVTGRRAGVAACGIVSRPQPRPDLGLVADREYELRAIEQGTSPALEPAEVKERIRAVMWHAAGILRSGEALAEGVRQAASLAEELAQRRSATLSGYRAYVEAQNMALAANLICRAAGLRRESRGAHQRTDFPDQDDEHFRRNLCLRREAQGQPVLIP